MLVRQAVAEAGRPAPVCINAGIGGDTAAGMRKRIERDVLVHRPTLMSLSVGINDILRGVKPADYEADVTAIAEQLKADHIPMLILTTSILGPKTGDADKRLADYNAILRRLAERYGCRVAEVNQRMQDARAAGLNALEEDHVHPNWEGHRIMARAVLDALGHRDVPLPKALKAELMAGVIREWRIRAVPDKAPPLDEKAVASLGLDESWKVYTLPEASPAPSWWLEQERQRGFALSLPGLVGPGKSYQGIAHVEAAAPKWVYFNTGAQLECLWLDGTRLYKRQEWTGWHAGRDRIAAQLRAGRNVIVIETGGEFFLSITDDNAW
jgi:lysophospholipase L1-like esterase